MRNPFRRTPRPLAAANQGQRPRRLSPAFREFCWSIGCFAGGGAAIGYVCDGGESALGGVTLGLFLWLLGAYDQRCENRRERFLEASGRGRKLLTSAQAAEQATKLLVSNPTQESILWGGARLPITSLHNHVAIIGSTGSGKTLTFRMLMQQLLPTIRLGTDRRAMIYDPKLEMAQIVGTLRNLRVPVRLFNPFDARSTPWNIGRDCTSPAAAHQVASAFIPSTQESQPFFRDAARNLLTAVLSLLIRRYPGRWTLREALLLMRSKRALRSFLEQDAAFAPVVENYLDVSDVTLSSILSTAATHLSPLEPVAALWNRSPNRSFSISEWVSSASILIIGGDPRFKSTLDKLNALLVAIATHQTLGQPESTERLSLFLFDEIRECGKIDLGKILVGGRSKSCAAVIGLQDVDGLAEVYGERVALEMLGQCGLKAFLKLESAKTAEWCSKSIGDLERIERNVSNSRSSSGGSTSESFARHTRPQIMPSEFLSLPATNTTNGLHAAYLAREIGAWRHAYSWHDLVRQVGPVDRNIPGYVAAPLEGQFLRPFSPDEERRLGVSQPLAFMSGAGANHAPSEPPTPPLRRIAF